MTYNNRFPKKIKSGTYWYEFHGRLEAVSNMFPYTYVRANDRRLLGEDDIDDYSWVEKFNFIPVSPLTMLLFGQKRQLALLGYK